MKKKIIRNIIFCRTPLKSAFKFKDVFQIIPIDFEKAPTSEIVGDIPLLIEYWFDEDTKVEVSDEYKELDILVKDIPRQKAINNLLKLFSATTNFRLYSIDGVKKWGVVMSDFLEDSDDGSLNVRSKVFIEAYLYPEISSDLKVYKFSNAGYPDTPIKPHTFYYYYDPLEDKEKEIDLPDTFNEILEAYFNLEPKSKKVADSVIHLICNGVDLRSTMQSLSFISFVSAIETLENFSKGKNKEIKVCSDCQTPLKSTIICKKCESPLWGIKIRFLEFLKTYISASDISIQKYNRIYKIRSKIVHEGLLLLGDADIDWADSDESNEAFKTHVEAMQLAKLSFVNWLLQKKLTTSKT